MNKEIENVGIYTRVSRKDQDCTRQINDLKDWATRCKYNVVLEVTETMSGARQDRKERAKLIALAKQRKIDSILVTEMSRWGRSLQDLITTLQELNSYGVSVICLNGFSFDMSTAQGRLMAGVIGALAEFERDLIRERVISGIENAKAKGKKMGRPIRDKKPSDKHAKKVMAFLNEGRTYRWIAHELHISKNTVMKLARKAESNAITR